MARKFDREFEIAKEKKFLVDVGGLDEATASNLAKDIVDKKNIIKQNFTINKKTQNPKKDKSSEVDIKDYNSSIQDILSKKNIEFEEDATRFNFPIAIPKFNVLFEEKKTTNGEILTIEKIRNKFENRKAIYEKLKDYGGDGREGTSRIGSNVQCVPTPFNIAREMVELFSLEELRFSEIYVMFSLEFLEVLVSEKGINPKNIHFFSDNIPKCKWAKVMYNVDGYIVNINEFLSQKENDMPKSNNIIVIGNPPYNEGSNAKDSKPIYNRFIETIIDCVEPNKFSMIVPSRWMIGGKGLDSFRERMMNDTHMKVCVDFKNSYDIFPGVDIAVGVNYFLWDSEYIGGCNFNGVERNLNDFDIVVRDVEALSIIKKIKKSSGTFLVDNVSVSKPYNIRTSEPPTKDGVLCLYTQSLGKQYVDNNSVIDKQNNINKWKVIAPIAPIAGQTNFDKPISIYNNNNIILLPPTEICSETYIVLNSFETKEACNNFVSYMKTKFFRLMLLLRIDGQNVSRDCYSWVPDQLDYTKEYTDEELYEKYNLSQEEISYIESKIKSI